MRNLGHAVLDEQHLELIGDHPQCKGSDGLGIVSSLVQLQDASSLSESPKKQLH